jgi:hypothetical protein
VVGMEFSKKKFSFCIINGIESTLAASIIFDFKTNKQTILHSHAVTVVFVFYLFGVKNLQQGGGTKYQPIELLLDLGIGANDIEKLKNAGYHTVESVRSPSPSNDGNKECVKCYPPFSFISFLLSFSLTMLTYCVLLLLLRLLLQPHFRLLILQLDVLQMSKVFQKPK